MNTRCKSWLTFVMGLLIIFVYSCKKDYWDRHTKIRNQDLSTSLIQALDANPELSRFTEALKTSGLYDSLKLSKVYTVWALTNTAMSSLNDDVIGNVDALQRFLKFHIAYQSHFRPQEGQIDTIMTLGGKNALFGNNSFQEATLLSGDKYLSDGVLHVVDQASLPLLNAWEFLDISGATTLRDFIRSLRYKELDVSMGEVLYIDPVSKMPVYREGTTFWVERNYFNQRIADMTNEDSLYTFILIDNSCYETERQKLQGYYKTGDQHFSDSVTQWNVVKDLCVRGVVSESQLAGGVISSQGLSFHINPSAITKRQKLSNGIAYVVNAVNYNLLENKIPPIVVEGEFPDSLRTPSVPVKKIRKDINGNRFVDYTVASITSAPDPLNYFRYLTTAAATHYKVYVRALNDIYQTPITMRIDFSSNSYFPKAAETALTSSGYFSIAPFNSLTNPYNEILIGTHEQKQYGDLYLFLVSAATGVNSTLPTALTLDYIKLVPIN